MTARRHEMTKELNDGNAVAAIIVIAKVPSVHERAVPLAMAKNIHENSYACHEIKLFKVSNPNCP